ncbi:MAG: rhodanese-like domain-containing protein [Thermomicrobiales bacterium]
MIPPIRDFDVRTAAEYATSHIPGAVNVPVCSISSRPMALLPMPELEAVFEAAGVTDMEIIVYCQTGIRASNGVFALNVLGYPDVKLYADSWTGWSSDPAHPVEP